MGLHKSARGTRAADQVYLDTWEGHPQDAIKKLNASVGQLSRHYGYHLKIGITNDPVRRWRQGYRYAGWEYMTAIYVSHLHEHVCEAERALIERLKKKVSKSPGYYYNKVGGGGGRKGAAGPYYLYVVTAPRHSRIIVSSRVERFTSAADSPS